MVILSGLVILAVEATSMGAGSYLSNKTAELVETDGKEKRWVFLNSIKAGLIMLFFYVFGGVIPLMPYFFLTTRAAIPVSIFLTILALVGVGFWTGRVTKRSGWRAAVEMVVVSLGAAAIGYGIGLLASWFFNIDI
jgi:VIT1/CCC1 family predicted Fe2+/Mn2+ transporter